MRTPSGMTLERILLDQEEIIEKQAAMIRGLLYELLQFRALTKEEYGILMATKEKTEAN